LKISTALKRIFFALVESAFKAAPQLADSNYVFIFRYSTEIVLCKKWEVNYVILNGIMRSPKLTSITYEFEKDKTCSILDSAFSKKTEGKWLFDSGKNVIKLLFRKDAENEITSLSQNELVIESRYVEKETGHSVQIKTFLKRKDN